MSLAALIGIAGLGWACAVALFLERLAARGHRYVIRSLWWRRRSPVGHRNHAILRFGEYFMASCECGFTERALSHGAGEGSLAAHLRTARPWVHYAGPEPCAGDETGVLTQEDADFVHDYHESLAGMEQPTTATV